MGLVVRCDRCNKEMQKNATLYKVQITIGGSQRSQDVCSTCKREWERQVKDIGR